MKEYLLGIKDLKTEKKKKKNISCSRKLVKKAKNAFIILILSHF